MGTEPKGGRGTEPKGGKGGQSLRGEKGTSLRGGQKTMDDSWIKSGQTLSFCESPMTSSLPFLPPPLFRVLNFFLFFLQTTWRLTSLSFKSLSHASALSQPVSQPIPHMDSLYNNNPFFSSGFRVRASLKLKPVGRVLKNWMGQG